MFFAKFLKIFKNFKKFKPKIERAKVISHGRGKLPIFQFLVKPEKTALHLYLFSDFFQLFPKKSKNFKEMKKRVYNKKIHPKMTILQKSSKK